MSPDYVNVEDLSRETNDDNVVLSGVNFNDPALESALSDVTKAVEAQGKGSVKIVILDRTPAQPADLRDIATEVQQRTGANTVIVRSPGTGAVVSDTYSRKAIEQAEKTMYGNPDYVASAQVFMDTINADVNPWKEINVGIGAAVVAAVCVTAWSTWRRGSRGNTGGERVATQTPAADIR